ncbi:hypothetical protein KXQ82_14315 [Mucilaginibacter sp. HMF5004]|uniref:hypothetical protein n=1 Tax=Mucilaginibacter rivuli TaxID=2857527 RepID=UPI001C5E12CD|nr:hypothetical protein [Mucilaginibacter rivuli]MBW4890898.1 hypothetical protein [Mucilaginibacter rivuli]
MKKNDLTYLIFLSVILAVYYLVLGLNIHSKGYYNHESLFYIEKARIVFQGMGNRLKVIGLTAPILPFYGIMPFIFNYSLAPYIASAIGTAVLFLIIGICTLKTTKDPFYMLVLLALFIFHPGIIYMAGCGKSIYIIIIFFFLFFYNTFRFYYSNTTFHISISSILLVALVFCDYRFIWMTLFFVPLVISISLQSLNLAEKQSIFRLFLSFNNPSLRRKLVNKTFAVYIIIFILPLIAILCYKILNQTHANDFNYFLDNPYATWNVLVNKLESTVTPSTDNYKLPEVSFLTSVRVIIYCPLLVLGGFLLRHNIQHLLTLLIPLALVEFLKIEYPDNFLSQQYYLIFIFMSFMAVLFKSNIVSQSNIYKYAIGACIVVELVTGYSYLNNSFFESEKNFYAIATQPKPDNGLENQSRYDEYIDVAAFINSMPRNSRILVDDANAYPIAAFVKNMQKLTLPYQNIFLSAIENPSTYVDYILVASNSNKVGGYTQLNEKYKAIMQSKNNIMMDRNYESDNWIIYKLREKNPGRN